MSSLAPTKRNTPANSIPGDPGLLAWLRRLGASTVGAKFIVALTGLALTGFVVIHMLGNMQMFLGQDPVNRYAAFLKSQGPLLWVARLGLLAVFVLHVGLAMRLTRRSAQARPVPYMHKETVQASLASRYMFQSGMVILIFLVFHLAHYTLGWVKGAEIEPGKPPVNYLDLRDMQGRHDVYNMTIFGFREPMIAILYLAAQVFLFLHLSHGVQSTFQTLGINGPRWQGFVRCLGLAIATLVVAGNIAIVLGVWLGWLQPILPLRAVGG